MDTGVDKKLSIAPEGIFLYYLIVLINLAIVPVLACVLNQLCARNDQLPIDQNSFTKFHALRPPSINLCEYLERVAKYAACSGECFVLSLVYIDNIIHNNNTFIVNSLNVHRLLITSIMLAAKHFDDHYYNNEYYAKIGGVSTTELNILEVELLFMLNFNLFVTSDQFSQYYVELCRHAVHSPCTCSSGPPLFALIPSELNPAQLIYDLNTIMSISTCMLTPSPSPNFHMKD